MKQNYVKLLAVCAGFFLFTTNLAAQDDKKSSAVRDAYIISAKAGAVNFVSGKVAVVRQKGKSGYLDKGDDLQVGDKVITGGSGKAEILLNPGSFVRLAGNSEFEFITTDLDDLQVKVNTGSAIFEVITSQEFRVVVNTPKSRFFIVKSGIYRVDAMADGTAKLEVWKGKAQIGEGKGVALKGGQATVINSAQVAVEKFDRDEKDDFELWSKERAKELDKINAKLRAKEMNQALLASYTQDRWSVGSSFGLWVRDPLTRSYCFLPFAWGWSSPYGHSYDRSISSYQQTTNNIYANNPNWNSGNGQSQNNPSYPGSNGNGTAPTRPTYNPPRENTEMMAPPTSRLDKSAEPARVSDAKVP